MMQNDFNIYWRLQYVARHEWGLYHLSNYLPLFVFYVGFQFLILKMGYYGVTRSLEAIIKYLAADPNIKNGGAIKKNKTSLDDITYGRYFQFGAQEPKIYSFNVVKYPLKIIEFTGYIFVYLFEKIILHCFTVQLALRGIKLLNPTYTIPNTIEGAICDLYLELLNQAIFTVHTINKKLYYMTVIRFKNIKSYWNRFTGLIIQHCYNLNFKMIYNNILSGFILIIKLTVQIFKKFKSLCEYLSLIVMEIFTNITILLRFPVQVFGLFIGWLVSLPFMPITELKILNSLPYNCRNLMVLIYIYIRQINNFLQLLVESKYARQDLFMRCQKFGIFHIRYGKWVIIKIFKIYVINLQILIAALLLTDLVSFTLTYTASVLAPVNSPADLVSLKDPYLDLVFLKFGGFCRNHIKAPIGLLESIVLYFYHKLNVIYTPMASLGKDLMYPIKLVLTVIYEIISVHIWYPLEVVINIPLLTCVYCLDFIRIIEFKYCRSIEHRNMTGALYLKNKSMHPYLKPVSHGIFRTIGGYIAGLLLYGLKIFKNIHKIAMVATLAYMYINYQITYFEILENILMLVIINLIAYFIYDTDYHPDTKKLIESLYNYRSEKLSQRIAERVDYFSKIIPVIKSKKFGKVAPAIKWKRNSFMTWPQEIERLYLVKTTRACFFPSYSFKTGLKICDILKKEMNFENIMEIYRGSIRNLKHVPLTCDLLSEQGLINKHASLLKLCEGLNKYQGKDFVANWHILQCQKALSSLTKRLKKGIFDEGLDFSEYDKLKPDQATGGINTWTSKINLSCYNLIPIIIYHNIKIGKNMVSYHHLNTLTSKYFKIWFFDLMLNNMISGWVDKMNQNKIYSEYVEKLGKRKWTRRDLIESLVANGFIQFNTTSIGRNLRLNEQLIRFSHRQSWRGGLYYNYFNNGVFRPSVAISDVVIDIFIEKIRQRLMTVLSLDLIDAIIKNIGKRAGSEPVNPGELNQVLHTTYLIELLRGVYTLLETAEQDLNNIIIRRNQRIMVEFPCVSQLKHAYWTSWHKETQSKLKSMFNGPEFEKFLKDFDTSCEALKCFDRDIHLWLKYVKFNKTDLKLTNKIANIIELVGICYRGIKFWTRDYNRQYVDRVMEFRELENFRVIYELEAQKHGYAPGYALMLYFFAVAGFVIMSSSIPISLKLLVLGLVYGLLFEAANKTRQLLSQIQLLKKAKKTESQIRRFTDRHL